MSDPMLDLGRLSDDVLTYIEQREAEQIAYGMYRVTLSGRELITEYRPVDSTLPPLSDREAVLSTVLRHLDAALLIIRFNDADDPAEWMFRSRIAEIVRLLTLLRQRIAKNAGEQQRQRISGLKRLSGDVTFHVAPRRVPRRWRVPSDYLDLLTDAGPDAVVCRDILREVIETRLPKVRTISQFQEDGLHAILQIIALGQQRSMERGVVVTAGTGAGKTYAFFLPMLAKMIIDRCLRQQVGVKAICLYPRVALSENQLSDFVEALFHVNQILADRQLPQLTIGIESGAAVYQEYDLSRTSAWQRDLLRKRGWSFDEEFGGYLSPFAYCVGTDGCSCADKPKRLGVLLTDTTVLRCPVCGQLYPFIRFARDVMRTSPPDVLVATTESLNRRLLSSEYQYLFGTTRFVAPSVVMLDEIHLQTSTAGTQVALLLRRVLSRIRLGKQERGDTHNLAFVGLSATIARPTEFLAELTGLPITRISEIRPHEDALEVIGAERYIFVRAEDSEDTAVLSTLIQTTMCVLHTMPQPPSGSDLSKYRAFGFVQSLDVVGRWRYQMEDAERQRPWQIEQRKQHREHNNPLESRPITDVPLYAYRFPPFNRRLFPHLFGHASSGDCGCERGLPDPACPYFRSGECWWVLSQRTMARVEPLVIKRKSGSDRDTPIDPDDDLIITTSALEVGYDDDALMCVIQYTAPSNVASFVQRKGRGGRKVGTRPIVVTVLSPYKSTDLFLFRNQHVLIDPVFRKVPLHSQNRFLQRIHGFYALFDWLCYRAHVTGTCLEFEKLDSASFRYLLQQTADPNILLAFKDYLRRCFAMDVEALSRVLTSDPDGLLLGILDNGLVQNVHPRISTGDKEVFLRKILRGYLPENLFSDINLPEVRVNYRPESTSSSVPQAESISLALTETIPGNVTFRGGQGAVWVPPIAVDPSRPLVEIDSYYTTEELREQVDTVKLPGRALKLVGIQPQRVRTLTIYRPVDIMPKQFSVNHNRSFWFADPETGMLEEHRGDSSVSQVVKRLAHSSSAYPIQATAFRAERETPTRAYTLERSHTSLRTNDLATALFTQAVIHSDEPDNLNLLKVQRLILGSQYTLMFDQGQAEEIGGRSGFCRQNHLGNVALGFEMLTEALVFDLDLATLDECTLSPILARRIRSNSIRHRFISLLTVEYGAQYFPASNLADALLTLVDQRLNTNGQHIDDLRSWLHPDNPEFTSTLNRAMTDIHGFSDKKQKGVRRLVEQDRYLSLFLDICTHSEPGEPLFRQYLRDTFVYSVAIALRQVAQEIAGVEALNYVAASTELQADFEGRAANRIWLYEIGVGGIGVLRATQELLRTHPERIWSELTHKLTHCPTAQEEALLRHLLTQPEPWLTTCSQHVERVLAARTATERRQNLECLHGLVRRQLGLPVPPEQIKALLRVFGPDYNDTSVDHQIANWRLYREINVEFLPRCTSEFGREPSFTEASALLYQAVSAPSPEGDTPAYPELRTLLRAYEDEYGPRPARRPALDAFIKQVRKTFENAVERRLLITCRGSCPSCLDDRSGDIESPGLARQILSQTLLAEWLDQVRCSATLTVSSGDAPETILDQLRSVFEQGNQAAYIRAEGRQLAALCATVSYLTDAGVDTAMGMYYPLIVDVRTVYPADPVQPPLVELTIRPLM